MRNTLMILAGAILLAAGYAMGDRTYRSAAAWGEHSLPERLMYVQGFRDGLKRGELDGSVLAGNAKRVDTDEYLKRVQKELREQLGTG